MTPQALRPVLLLLALANVACPAPAALDDEPGVDTGVDTRALPAFFRLQGSAAAAQDGFDVECLLDWHFELREEVRRDDDVLAYTGVKGGELARSLLDDTEAGVALRADVFAEVTVTWTQPDALRIDIPINATAIERIYLSLVTLEGTVSSDGQTAQGAWTCAPFDVEQGGIRDDTIFAPGTWSTAPEDVVPEP